MAVAASPFLLPCPFPNPSLLAAPLKRSLPRGRSFRCSPNGAAVPDSPKPASRRGRKKSPPTSEPKAKATMRRTKKGVQGSDSEGEEFPAKRTSRRKRKTKQEVKQEEDSVDLGSNYHDADDFGNEWPPLVCCFGAPRWEFVPTVRVSDRQMHPDQYSTWLHLQWEPPEFARAPGSAASNVAIAHTRLGGRAAMLGKVGDDNFGRELVYRMNREGVQTRAIKFDEGTATALAHMKVSFRGREDGKGGTKLVAETVKNSAEDSFRKTEINLDVLKEVSW
jgi:hypothetical protein